MPKRRRGDVGLAQMEVSWRNHERRISELEGRLQNAGLKRLRRAMTDKKVYDLAASVDEIHKGLGERLKEVLELREQARKMNDRIEHLTTQVQRLFQIPGHGHAHPGDPTQDDLWTWKEEARALLRKGEPLDMMRLRLDQWNDAGATFTKLLHELAMEALQKLQGD